MSGPQRTCLRAAMIPLHGHASSEPAAPPCPSWKFRTVRYFCPLLVCGKPSGGHHLGHDGTAASACARRGDSDGSSVIRLHGRLHSWAGNADGYSCGWTARCAGGHDVGGLSLERRSGASRILAPRSPRLEWPPTCTRCASAVHACGDDTKGVCDVQHVGARQAALQAHCR